MSQGADILSKYHDAEFSRRLATDPRSPAEFRCKGVLRNVPKFYASFDVKQKQEALACR